MKLLLLTLATLPPSSVLASEPLDIGSQRQLPLDDFIIERIDGLKRVMHRPEKKGAVFLPRGATDGDPDCPPDAGYNSGTLRF